MDRDEVVCIIFAWITLLQRLVPSSLVTRFDAPVDVAWEEQGGHVGRSFGSGLSDLL